MSTSSPILAQKIKNRRLIVTFERLTAILHFYGIACHTIKNLTRHSRKGNRIFVLLTPFYFCHKWRYYAKKRGNRIVTGFGILLPFFSSTKKPSTSSCVKHSSGGRGGRVCAISSDVSTLDSVAPSVYFADFFLDSSKCRFVPTFDCIGRNEEAVGN